MDYLFDVEKYPYINDKMIDDLVNTAQMHINCKMIGYTSMEWSMSSLKMEQVKKYKPSWSLARINWDGATWYLPPIFDKIEEAYKWLNYNCQYIPRKEIGVDNYE
jgi:hypothetical protein